jgi:methionyl-tRNA formyltransferase
LLQSLEKLASGKLQPQTQDNTKASYAEKIEKQEAELDWQSSAKNLDRKIRAFNPWPVAFVKLNSENLRVWKAKFLTEKTTANPGTVIRVDKTGIDIATGDGVLRILELQMPGGKKLSVSEFLNSRKDFFKVGLRIVG